MTDTLFIGFDKAKDGDIPTLIIGRVDQIEHTVDILNAQQGNDAVHLYRMLIDPEYYLKQKGDVNHAGSDN